MKKVFSWIDKNFEPIIITTIFYTMTLLITLQVILRFGFQSGFSWGEEVSRFMFVWLMFFGFSFATRNQRHIRINFVVDKFGLTAKKVIYIISDVLFLTFLAFIAKAGIDVTKSIIKYGDMAVTVKVSMNIIYLAGLIGFIMMGIRMVQSIVYKLMNFKEPFEKFENFTGKYSGADEICIYTQSVKDKEIAAKAEMENVAEEMHEDNETKGEK